LGKAKTVREGKDLSIITYGALVQTFAGGGKAS